MRETSIVATHRAGSKRTIIAFTACYLPGYKGGGPIRSVANIVDRLSEEFSFRVLTGDRDHGESSPYPGVNVDCWTRVGKADVYYASRRGRTARGLIRLLREVSYDALYLNSLFNARFTLLPLVLRRLRVIEQKPVIIAPRGELDAGALALKSRKKRVFLTLARCVRLYSGLIWQASSELEAERIIGVMQVPPSRVFVAPNLPTPVAPASALDRREPEARLTVSFLSRISRKKNLDYALRALSAVRSPVAFSIFGNAEDGVYWSECLTLISELPDHIRVDYCGDVPHEQVHEVLAASDLFLLPTKGENYGHVVVEALAAGTPVLISDQTPWLDLAERGVGWSLPLLDERAFARVIDEFATLSVEDRKAMSDRARMYADEITSADDAVQSNIALFRNALSVPRDQFG